MTERHIRYSQFASFKRCRRKWMLEYVQGLELDRAPGVTKGARDVGTLFHLGVEAYYKGDSWRIALDARQDELSEGAVFSSEWADSFNLVRIMLEGYVEWVRRTGVDTSEEVLHVEPQLSAEFAEVRGDLIILTGKPDLIVRDVLSDAVTLVDTKTVQSLTQVQNHAGQGLTYALLAKMQLDLDVTLFRTNQARKVKRTSTAKPPFYGRAEMVVTPKHLETHRNHLLGQLDTMVELMQQWEEKGYSPRQDHDQLFYPNQTATCDWECDYLPVCKQMDDGSNFEHTIRNYYRHKPVYTPNIPETE